MSMTTDTITNVVDTYISAWNERVPERRRALVAAAFADDATYVDPARSGTGADGIDAMISGAQEDHPGVQLVLAGAPDAHGDHVRFTWHLRPAGSEEVAMIGYDFASVAPDGRLRDVVGFVEVPAAAA
jgi:SnoaL-like domain